jgi:hypothetical protein
MMVTGQEAVTQAVKRFIMNEGWALGWVGGGGWSSLSFTDNSGVRYFDQAWLRKVGDIVEDNKGNVN